MVQQCTELQAGMVQDGLSLVAVEWGVACVGYGSGLGL